MSALTEFFCGHIERCKVLVLLLDRPENRWTRAVGRSTKNLLSELGLTIRAADRPAHGRWQTKWMSGCRGKFEEMSSVGIWQRRQCWHGNRLRPQAVDKFRASHPREPSGDDVTRIFILLVTADVRRLIFPLLRCPGQVELLSRLATA